MLTCIADWPIGKWSLVNAASCIVSLKRHGPGGEAGTRQVGGPRVVLPDGVQDRRVVHAGLVRHHEELVGDRELHVAPRVREELRQLGFLRGRSHDLVREPPEQGLGAVPDLDVVGAHDLGQRPELLERVALGDPLRAERDAHATPALASAWATYSVVPG